MILILIIRTIIASIDFLINYISFSILDNNSDSDLLSVLISRTFSIIRASREPSLDISIKQESTSYRSLSFRRLMLLIKILRAPYFKKSNIIEFLDKFNNLYENYRVANKDRVRRLP